MVSGADDRGTPASRYHDATKHHFHRYARSLGYLDWATQPDPFRRYAGAPLLDLPRPAIAPPTLYADLYDGAGPGPGSVPSSAMTLDTIGSFLRHSMGLSAWKQHGSPGAGGARWALRVNPSSGNLHPTEAYVAWRDRVWHYAPRAHALEERAIASPIIEAGFLVGLTSIHWREAWKYGERAFRYCQHDTGHAIAALRLAAAMHGWRLELLPWTSAEVGALLGVDRDDDYAGAEREEAECVALVWAGERPAVDAAPLVAAARAARWAGVANRLSPERVEWPAIDGVAEATREQNPNPRSQDPNPKEPAHPRTSAPANRPASEIFLQRRSAVSFDPRGHLRRDAFLDMLGRLDPSAPPFDAIDWPPQIQLALFVHRVQDVVPGIYACVRDAAAVDELRAAMRPEFLWEAIGRGLYLLAPVDAKATANRLSCNQDIAEDGFFSLGMLARFESSLEKRGDAFYRRLFWEAGMVGQVLYLEAEAAGARGTGIGCFFDDPVHQLLGIAGHAWQSLYHFSMGLPVEDGRLTTEPGYEWEK